MCTSYCFSFSKRLLLAFGCILALSAPVMANNGTSPQVLSLPAGPGSLGGIGENVQPNLNMGLMSYQIRVLVPEGRGSATPNPSITYSSSGGAGLMGIGWNFSAGSSVMRGTVRGLPTYTNDDVMFAGGELVKIPGGSFYRSRFEGGFKRHRWVQKDANDQRGYWIVELPDGAKMYYGANSKGELDLDAQVYGLKGTYCWKLVTMVDRNGNRVEYSYFKDGPQSYIDQIAWVFDKDGKPLYHLKFGYEERPDHISDGKPGFDLKTTKRIKEVRITSNGERFRSYSFDYEDATGLSRLIKVTRYGRDAAKAYPIQFSMKYSDAVFSPENSKMVKMPTSLGVDFRSGNIDFLDINGDGLPDVVDTSKPKHIFFMNQVTLKNDIKQDAHDFPKGLLKENLKETSAKLSNPSVQMLDVNGDGFTDMVDAVNKKIYINKGNTKWEDGSTSIQNFPVTGKDPNMRFMDYNGDKKIDVISSDGSSTTFWVSDGKGNWVVTPGKVNIGLGFSKDKLRLIDINGDGLQDVVHITKNAMRYRKYLGYGEWTQWISMKVPGIDQYELSTKAQFNDINGDGMADMVAFLGSAIVYFVNKNGEEFAEGKKLETFAGIDIPDASKMTIRIVDINGNGSRDIVWIDSSGRVTYLELFGKRPNLMEEISNGIGQRINVEYGSSVYFYLRDKTCKVGTDKACTGPWQNKMPMAFTVVTKIQTWASRSDKPADQKEPTKEEKPQIQSIFYHNGFYDGNEKKFRGFRHVESLYDGDDSIDPRKDEIKYDVGDTDVYMHGKLLMQGITDNGEKTFRTTATTWGDCPVELGGTDPKKLDPPVRFVCQKSQETTVMEGSQDKSKWKVTRRESTYDGYGNVTLSMNFGEKSKEGDEKVAKTTYITPKDPNDEASLWLLRYPSKIEHCGSKAGPCAATEFFYDGESYKGLPAGEIRVGNRTRTREQVSDNEFVDARRVKFDKYGNVVGAQTANGLFRLIEWDGTYARFATKETIQGKGISLTTSTRWDYSLSRVVQSTDLNGQIKKYNYDTFGRLVAMFQPGDAKDAPSIKYTYKLAAPLSWIVTEKRSKQGKDFDLKDIQCFDGLGRKLSQQVKVKDGVFLVSSHTAYNRLNGVAQTWSNYEGDGSCTFAPAGTPSTTTFSYDGLGRLVQTTLPNGDQERIVYEPFKTISFDAEDNKKDSPHANTPKTSIVDGLGRVIEEITMPTQGKSIKKTFLFDNVNSRGAELVKSVTLADGSVKEHQYDLRGNLLRIIDPDRSTVSFTYDKENRVLTRTDARGVIIVNTYDLLGRLLTRQEKGKPETKVSYQYDTAHKDLSSASNVKGRLVRVVFPAGAILQSYDARGNIVLVRRILMGHTFDFKSTYNNARQLISATLPDGRNVTLTRDGAGRLVSVSGKLKLLAYLPNGLIQSATFANGVTMTQTYDQRFRPQSIDVGGGKVMKLEFKIDGAGNPTEIKQTHGGESFTNSYEYDALYRLTKSTVGSQKEVMEYSFNDLHNLTNKASKLGDKSPAHLGQFQYDDKKIHAVTQAGKMKLSYDKAGHLTSRDGVALTWDYMGRMLGAKQGETTLGRFWYSDGHRRVIKEEGGLHVFYISKSYEIRRGVIVSYVRAQLDRLVASHTVKGVEAFFDDMNKDKKILSNDAWLYHAHRSGVAKASIKERPIDLDMTRDMLASSAHRLLHEDKEDNLFFHNDHLGSVRAVTNDAGDVVLRKHYYPYGVVRAASGNQQLTAYGFQSTEWDASTQSWAFLKRSFDPKLARWLSPDPAFEAISGTSDEFNSYCMTEGNPIAYRDEDGTIKKRAASAIVGVALSLTAGGIGAIFSAAMADGDTQIYGFILSGLGATIGLLATAVGYAVSAPKRQKVVAQGNAGGGGINQNQNGRANVPVDAQARGRGSNASSAPSVVNNLAPVAPNNPRQSIASAPRTKPRDFYAHAKNPYLQNNAGPRAPAGGGRLDANGRARKSTVVIPSSIGNGYDNATNPYTGKKGSGSNNNNKAGGAKPKLQKQNSASKSVKI